MEEEDNDLPPVANFFSKRAKLVAKVTPEEIKATTELLNKIQEEKSKITPAIKKPVRHKKTKKEDFPYFEAIAVEDEVKAIEDEVISTSPVTLSTATKRRLRKLQRERDLELKLIDDENKKIFSAIESSACDEVEEVPVYKFDSVNVLTVSYLSKISRLKCYDCDKFSIIFPKVAELFQLKASEFLLSFKEQIISVDDTPKSLNITDSDVLECIPYKLDESADAEIQYEENNLKIMFQSNDVKDKIDMVVHKLEKMQSIMEKYSKQRDIPLNLLIFEFDGERISGTETPEDLDMESGNCIDVTVLITLEKKKEVKERVETPKKPVVKKKPAVKKKSVGKRRSGRKKKDEVVIMDSESNDSDILIC